MHEFMWRFALRNAAGLPALLLGFALVYNWLGARDDLVRVMQHRYWAEVHQVQEKLDRTACAIMSQPQISGADRQACPPTPPESR